MTATNVVLPPTGRRYHRFTCGARVATALFAGAMMIGCRPARTPAGLDADGPSFVIGPPSAEESQLTWLAREWAGGTGIASCGSAPAFGDPLWFPDGQYCGLVTQDRGVVGLQLDGGGRLRAVTWHRNTADQASAASIVDSLDMVMGTRGLATRWCEPGSSPAGEIEAVVWERDDLLVYLSTITSDTPPPRIVAMATDEPRAFPQVLCKSAPQRPVRPRAAAGPAA